MEEILRSANPIEKEYIRNCKFPGYEVLRSDEGKRQRMSDLENATRLGNNDHNKIRIVFEDTEGIKYVHTTIWAATDHVIELKAGVHIPVNRIHKVIFI